MHMHMNLKWRRLYWYKWFLFNPIFGDTYCCYIYLYTSQYPYTYTQIVHIHIHIHIHSYSCTCIYVYNYLLTYSFIHMYLVHTSYLHTTPLVTTPLPQWLQLPWRPCCFWANERSNTLASASRPYHSSPWGKHGKHTKNIGKTTLFHKKNQPMWGYQHGKMSKWDSEQSIYLDTPLMSTFFQSSAACGWKKVQL